MKRTYYALKEDWYAFDITFVPRAVVAALPASLMASIIVPQKSPALVIIICLLFIWAMMILIIHFCWSFIFGWEKIKAEDAEYDPRRGFY